MTLPTIFCPECETLVLDAAGCPACDWRRPPAGGAVGRPAWAAALEAKLPRKGARPAVSGSRVHLPTEDGQLVTLDASRPDDPILGRYCLEAGYQCHTLAVWGDRLVVGAEYGKGFPAPQGALQVVSPGGELEWRHPAPEGGSSLSVPAVQPDGLAWYTVNSGWLVAADLAARREVWRRRLPANWGWAPDPPLRTPSGLFVLPGRCNTLLALADEGQRVAWELPAAGWFPHTPRLVEDTLYVRGWDHHVYALEAASGRVLWRTAAPRDYTSDLYCHGDYLLVGAKDYRGGADQGPPAHALYVLERRSGRLVARYEVAGHVFARPVAAEGIAFFATDDRNYELLSQGTFYAFDLEHCQLCWPPLVVEPRFQCDLVLCGDLVIAATRQGAVYAVRWRAAETALESPAVYLERGEWEAAAVAHALSGDYAAAAELYAGRLARPYAAAQLYDRAGQPAQVLQLLQGSPEARGRQLALQAARSLPDPAQAARSLRAMGELAAAAERYAAAGDWEAAGECYLELQRWNDALDAFRRAGATERWRALSRELGDWESVVVQMQDEGRHAEAGEEYFQHGYFLEAADCFERAGQPGRALDALQRIGRERLNADAYRRIARLAGAGDRPELAIEAHQALGELAQAAALAERLERYDQALDLYRQCGEELKAGEMLEKLGRHAEAAELFEAHQEWGRASENWERQVDATICRKGGARYARRDPQLEDWLRRAVHAYQEEADRVELDQVAACRQHAAHCQVKLMQLRGEPLLQLSLQARGLIYRQGNAVAYVVRNAGWGTASNLTLSVSGDNVRPIEPLQLGTLARLEERQREISIVPEIWGDVTLRVQLEGRAATGEVLSELSTYTVTVARNDNILEQLLMQGEQRVTLNINKYVATGGKSLEITDSAVVNRGTLWEEGGPATPNPHDTGPVSAADLARQVPPAPMPEAPPPESDTAGRETCPGCGRPVWGLLAGNPEIKTCPHCGASLR